jgi:RNA polymerase sigma-70 factor (ECF subfamily)
MTHRTDDRLSRLAQRIRKGDIAAFEELFRECHAPLCEVVDSYVRSQGIAEEIVQDLFFVLWMKRENWDLTGSVLGYLSTAARNRALHHLRHQAIARRWSQQVNEDDPSSAAMSRRLPQPDEALDAKEIAETLRRAMDQLPPRTRLAAVLRWNHEMSHAEVATMMGISLKGVEKLLGTAKQKLREQLGDFLARPFLNDPRD